MTPADLASARREAEEALANVTSADLECSTTSVVACVMALRSLLAATPEPAPALPEEVREAAESLQFEMDAMARKDLKYATVYLPAVRTLVYYIAARGGRS